MGQRCGKYLDTGPPRGPGHHSEDGRWWWDNDQGQWFRLTDRKDVLEIEVEDFGGTSLAANLATTLASQYGNAYFRFVARARGADPRWAHLRDRRGDLPGHPTFPGRCWSPGRLAGDPA